MDSLTQLQQNRRIIHIPDIVYAGKNLLPFFPTGLLALARTFPPIVEHAGLAAFTFTPANAVVLSALEQCHQEVSSGF